MQIASIMITVEPFDDERNLFTTQIIEHNVHSLLIRVDNCLIVDVTAGKSIYRGKVQYSLSCCQSAF